jgi:hypothetical protein
MRGAPIKTTECAQICCFSDPRYFCSAQSEQKRSSLITCGASISTIYKPANVSFGEAEGDLAYVWHTD